MSKRKRKIEASGGDPVVVQQHEWWTNRHTHLSSNHFHVDIQSTFRHADGISTTVPYAGFNRQCIHVSNPWDVLIQPSTVGNEQHAQKNLLVMLIHTDDCCT